MAAYNPAYKWGQTDTHVIVTLDAGEDHVSGHELTPEGSVRVEGAVPGKGAFVLELDLCAPIAVQRCQVLFKQRSTQRGSISPPLCHRVADSSGVSIPRRGA